MFNQPMLDCAHILRLAERELMLFALVWYAIGMVDEGAIDLLYAALRLTGRIVTPRVTVAGLLRTDDAAPAAAADRGVEAYPGAAPAPAALAGPIAVFVPAWREAAVIGPTIAHMLAVWRDPALTLYVGCYGNDPATIAAAMAAGGDARLRIVVNARPGPTTKADCLNRLYRAMAADEQRRGQRYRGVVLHDAEDMVHPLALAVIDRGLDHADLVQIPVRPELPAGPHWIAGHYADEFAESHTKALVVRGALGAGVPAAGVGCGIGRAMLARIAAMRGADGDAAAGGAGEVRGPFAPESLTEDYETGILIRRAGGRTLFLRLRDGNGALIATRSYFPDRLATAVRQKSRWIHGIAFQAWDRLGWDRCPIEVWMYLRDRKGPLSAVVLMVGYLLFAVELPLWWLRLRGVGLPLPPSPMLVRLMQIGIAGVVWRAALRGLFVAREYGAGEGLLAIARIPVANVVTIMAARRALAAYGATLRGAAVTWDKTAHDRHPALGEGGRGRIAGGDAGGGPGGGIAAA